MGATLAFSLRTAFLVLGILISATVIYTIVTDGFPFRKQLLTPWMAATLIDFYINILPIGVIQSYYGSRNLCFCLYPRLKVNLNFAEQALSLVFVSNFYGSNLQHLCVCFDFNYIQAWIVYRESNWIVSLVWIVFLICFGSITTCGYIFLRFLELSPQESLQDPIYFVLLKRKKDNESQSKGLLSVIWARALFILLGVFMVATLIYTTLKDGSPFRPDVLTPWMSATLVDFYVNVFALSVWVAYKEANWITATLWIVSLICLGSAWTCAYILVQLFHLTAQDPTFLILFRDASSKWI